MNDFERILDDEEITAQEVDEYYNNNLEGLRAKETPVEQNPHRN